jgi:hypothetical protein
VIPDPLKKLHVTVFVYGAKYVDQFARITLPNLAGLLEEIPPGLREGTRLRILTNAESADDLRPAPMLREIERIVAVDIADDMVLGGYELCGAYGPMILAQSRLVNEASREGAGIIFCPPDLLWSKGSFATIVELTNQGYRAIIGPSARGIQEDLVPILMQRIAEHPRGRLELPSLELTRLLFENWNEENEGFIWNSQQSNYWKAYSYWRLDQRHYLMRFHQGPMMYARPFREVVDYDGWIDHRLIKQCARSMREVYVIDDAIRLQTVDLMPRVRPGGLEQTPMAQRALFRQLMNRKRQCRFNVLYGAYTCRIYAEPLPEAAWRHAQRRFDRETLPAIYAAFLGRPFAAIGDGIWRHWKLDHRMVAPARRAARWLVRAARKLLRIARRAL